MRRQTYYYYVGGLRALPLRAPKIKKKENAKMDLEGPPRKGVPFFFNFPKCFFLYFFWPNFH